MTISRIFMCGDVMTGRGIDQILPHPSLPWIYEPYIRDSRTYVELAEDRNGPVPREVPFSYIWGDAISIFERIKPDLRIINLETAVTRSNDYWKWKGINYRMHPLNIPVITAAGINVCALANNHVIDWGYNGLVETLESLESAGIRTAGAGQDLSEATAPAIVEVAGKARVIVFGLGYKTSGILPQWAATAESPGVNLLEDLSDRTVNDIASRVSAVKGEGDLVIASIHWGGNWSYEIEPERIHFAHRLIDGAGIDIVHGHSSHHVQGIEIHNGKPIIYGCGDFINDYEGISGNESYRAELGLMYFADMEQETGRFLGLRMAPTRMRRFRVNKASQAETKWLIDTLNREGKRFGTRVEAEDGDLVLKWQ